VSINGTRRLGCDGGVANGTGRLGCDGGVGVEDAGLWPGVEQFKTLVLHLANSVQYRHGLSFFCLFK